MTSNKLIAAVIIIVMCALTTIPAYAAQNPFAQMEAQSRQAVEAAVKAGKVPQGTTIYDCMYGTGKNGETTVIKYRDKGGNWISVTKHNKNESIPEASTNRLSDETLAEYANEAFRLTNAEREKAGLAPLERDSLLDEAAMIRAPEIIIVDHAGGKPHTRPDGTSYKDLVTDMGGKGKRCGENIARSEATPQMVIDAWMRSEGHRKNILREDYGSIGIGVHQLPDGSLDWVQIFELE